jgi:hypothetical protein
MKEQSFFSQHEWLIIIIVGFACILVGRIWSNHLNWGEITDPQLIIKNGKYYKLVDLYLPKIWTEDWIVDSVICLKSNNRRFFVKYSRTIYVSGDRIRFADGEPEIGLYYQASFTKTTSGSIVMKPVELDTKNAKLL